MDLKGLKIRREHCIDWVLWFKKGVEFGMVLVGISIWDGFRRQLNLEWYSRELNFIMLNSHWLMISSCCSLIG